MMIYRLKVNKIHSIILINADLVTGYLPCPMKKRMDKSNEIMWLDVTL